MSLKNSFETFWSLAMKNKNFDCVKMMRDIREKIYLETKDLSGKEFIDYLNKKVPDFSGKTKATLTK